MARLVDFAHFHPRRAPVRNCEKQQQDCAQPCLQFRNNRRIEAAVSGDRFQIRTPENGLLD